MSNSSYYSGGVPMISVDDAEEIAELCLLAGRPDRIAEFLGGRLTPGEVRNRLEAKAPPPAPAARSNRPLFGDGPTAQQADALAAAIRRRFEAETKR